MGTAASIPVQPVRKPFHRKDGNALHALITAQDWQRVLARMDVYPTELARCREMNLYGLRKISVYPLQLMCALDPPAKVIEKALEYHSAAASKALRSKRRRMQGIVQRFRRWRRARKGHFPIEEEQLLSVSASSVDDDEGRLFTNPVDNASTLSSKSMKDVVLQLSPSGALSPLPMDLSGETGSITSHESFRVQWDLDPLKYEVQFHNGLLPLHLACLFQASPDVLELLLDAFRMGAITDVLGMLPIHLLAAGWKIPRPFPKPKVPGLTDERSPDESHSYVLEAITVLKKAMPESLRVLSGNHVMSALSYVEECMEAGDEKDECVRLLQEAESPWASNNNSFDESLVSGHLVQDPPHIFSDDSDVSTIYAEKEGSFVSCMHSLVRQADWDGVVKAVDQDPGVTTRWIYGIDEKSKEAQPMVWKRLPIHLVCFAKAPTRVHEAVLSAFPSCARIPDPLTGQTPLHTICTTGAPFVDVKLILSYYEGAVHALDHEARSPLHLAVVADAPFQVIELLITESPGSVAYTDASGQTPVEAAMTALGDEHVTTELLMMVLMHLSAQP